MVSDLRTAIAQWKEDLLTMEKRLPTYRQKSPSNISSNLDNRPAWNPGGGCSKANSLTYSNVSHRTTPVHTRSRSCTAHTLQQLNPNKLGGSAMKNVVHKQTINASDKTIVEVSVKTKQQGKRSMKPALAASNNQLVDQHGKIDPSHKKCEVPLNPRVVLPVMKEGSWANILLHKNPQPTILHEIPNKRVSDTSAQAWPTQEFRFDEIHQNGHNHIRGDGDAPKNPAAYQNLNHLVQELRGNARDPNIQRIAAEMEEILINSQSKENLEPPAASLRPTSRRRSRRSSTSPSKITPSQEPDFGVRSHVDSNLLRLSPAPETCDRHLPESKSDISDLIDRFRKAASAASQFSSQEEKHRSKKSRPKNVAAYREDLELACRNLEQSCIRMEADAQKMKSKQAELKRNLHDKEAKLESALISVEHLTSESTALRNNLRLANLEIQRLREDLSTKISTGGDLASLQKEVSNLSDENRTLSIELNMVKLEKERLAVMLSGKDKELHKFKQELIEERPKRYKKRAKQEEASRLIVNSSKGDITMKMEEETIAKPKKGNVESNKRRWEGDSVVEWKPRKTAEDEDVPMPEKEDTPEDEAIIVDNTPTSAHRFMFFPVDRAWQMKTSRRFGLRIRKWLKQKHTPRSLRPPKDCYRTSGDGNCFFRCVSTYAVGEEGEHGFFRASVVDYLRNHASEFEEGSDEEYLKVMATDGEWATDVEIRAAAKLLKTPIFTWLKYNKVDWQWQRFGPGGSFDVSLSDDPVPSLYLNHTSSCHYDVVKSVEEGEEASSLFS